MSTGELWKSPLRIFVYGTLRSGNAAHESFCRGAIMVVPARSTGCVERHPAGYPILTVPDDVILARGTGDALEDLATQQAWTGRVPEPSDARVEGEVISFGDAHTRLARLDDYEDFVPDGTGEYDRVLVPVRLENGRSVAAWTYVRPLQAREEAGDD